MASRFAADETSNNMALMDGPCDMWVVANPDSLGSYTVANSLSPVFVPPCHIVLPRPPTPDLDILYSQTGNKAIG